MSSNDITPLDDLVEEEFDTYWRCNQCESVCPGWSDIVPMPCDFCGSTDVEEVGPDGEEKPPKAPWDDPANWFNKE